MTPKHKAESQGKCRRFFYDKTTGDVLGVASGGGALNELTGDDLIVATFNNADAPITIGCVEEYFTPLGGRAPEAVDLVRVDELAQAVTTTRDARVARDRFVRETSLTEDLGLSRDHQDLDDHLDIKEILAEPGAKGRLIALRVQLRQRVNAHEDAMEALFTKRDEIVTLRAVPTQ